MRKTRRAETLGRRPRFAVFLAPRNFGEKSAWHDIEGPMGGPSNHSVAFSQANEGEDPRTPDVFRAQTNCENLAAR